MRNSGYHDCPCRYIDEWIDSASKPIYPAWSESFRTAHEIMKADLTHIALASRVREFGA